MTLSKAFCFVIASCIFCSCKNVAVKEGEKVFLKKSVGKKVLLPDGPQKTYLERKLKTSNPYNFPKSDYPSVEGVKDRHDIQPYATSTISKGVKTKVFSCLPNNVQEEKNIFGRTGTKSILPRHPGTAPVRNTTSLLEELQAAAPDEPVIIVGHNEDGLLVMPSGERLALVAIQEVCGERRLTPIIISCNASKYTSGIATSFSLTAQEGSDLSHILQANIENGMSLTSIGKIFADFKQLRDARNLRYYVTRIGIAGGGGAAYYVGKR